MFLISIDRVSNSVTNSVTKEDESRRAYIKKYSLLRDTAARAASAASQPPVQLPYDFRSPLPAALSSVEDVITFGQSLQAVAKTKLARPPLPGASPPVATDVIDVEAELGISLAGLRLQVSQHFTCCILG